MGGGLLCGVGQRGENWDNCNGINNKIFKKILVRNSVPAGDPAIEASLTGEEASWRLVSHFIIASFIMSLGKTSLAQSCSIFFLFLFLIIVFFQHYLALVSGTQHSD